MSVPCGILCLAYILKMFGKEYDITTLSSRLNASTEIWISDLGGIVMKYDLDVHLTCTSRLLDPSWFHSTSFLMEKIEHFSQTEAGMRKQAFTSILNYLKKGGTLEYKPATKSYLETGLKQKKIILACVSSAVFHGDPHRSGGHYVIVSGVSDKIWVLNPGNNTLLEQPVKTETFFFALESWGNWILLVIPAACSP